MKPISNDSKIVAKMVANAFLIFSIVWPIGCKVLSSAQLLKNVSSGYKSKSFKKILKTSGSKMDPWEAPAIISDHEL